MDVGRCARDSHPCAAPPARAAAGYRQGARAPSGRGKWCLGSGLAFGFSQAVLVRFIEGEEACVFTGRRHEQWRRRQGRGCPWRPIAGWHPPLPPCLLAREASSTMRSSLGHLRVGACRVRPAARAAALCLRCATCKSALGSPGTAAGHQRASAGLRAADPMHAQETDRSAQPSATSSWHANPSTTQHKQRQLHSPPGKSPASGGSGGERAVEPARAMRMRMRGRQPLRTASAPL